MTLELPSGAESDGLSLCFCSSGTLSYLFNNFVGDRSFSEVVAEAKKAGFTEPDPRDDLSGTDVARKVNRVASNNCCSKVLELMIVTHGIDTLSVVQVIILARESGLKLDLSDLPVRSLVPEPLKVNRLYTYLINFRIS